jgi:hypothetical protein
MTYSIQSKIIFLFSLTVVLISLISVVFPALISSTVSTNQLEKMGIDIIEQDPYQTGPLAGLLIISNVIIFAGYIFRKKIPKISNIFSFDIPHKISIIIVLVVIIGYGFLSFSEVNTNDEFDDWQEVLERLETGSAKINISLVEPFLRYFLLESSMNVFGDYKTIPLLFSMALLGVTYLFTTSLTKNRFAGIVSMVIVLQSNLFLTFDTSSTYTNFWILFYLLSLYAVVKVWFTNPVLYVSSIFCKSLTALFAPMSIFFILNSEIKKSYKIILIGVIVGILIIGAVTFGTSYNTNQTAELSWSEFWIGFTSFALQMRFDIVIILLLLPLVFGLFLRSKNNKHANSILILVVGVLLSAPLLTGMTDQTNQPYRFIPLVVFFAIGIGMLFSRTR